MNKLFVIVSILIIVMMGIVTFRYLTQPASQLNVDRTTSIIPTIKTPLQQTTPQAPKATISLIPSTSKVSQGKQFTVAVNLNTNASVYVVDLYLQYDIQAFTLVKIQPGDYFTDLQEFKKMTNQTTGNILYSTGALTSATGNRTLANLIFEAKTEINKGSIMVIKKTLVATKGAIPADVTLPTALTIQIVNPAP